MKTDPRPRKDWLCVVCRKDKRRNIPKGKTDRSKRELREMLEADPFCSDKCCRKWHGCELTTAGPLTDLEAA